MPPKILVYHQVGNSSTPPEEQRDLFDLIRDDGFITPAIDRISQAEMEKECFSGEDTESLDQVFQEGSSKGREAIMRIAESIIQKLPREGSSHTDFNCKDMLAGDFGRIFLSFGYFYSGLENGFIFDARDLVARGARIRPTDLLYEIVQAAKRGARRKYSGVFEAETAIKREIRRALEDHEMSGREALDFLDIYRNELGPIKGGGEYSQAELVWDGALSLELATEAWRNGKKVRL